MSLCNIFQIFQSIECARREKWWNKDDIKAIRKITCVDYVYSYFRKLYIRRHSFSKLKIIATFCPGTLKVFSDLSVSKRKFNRPCKKTRHFMARPVQIFLFTNKPEFFQYGQVPLRNTRLGVFWWEKTTIWSYGDRNIIMTFN